MRGTASGRVGFPDRSRPPTGDLGNCTGLHDGLVLCDQVGWEPLLMSACEWGDSTTDHQLTAPDLGEAETHEPGERADDGRAACRALPEAELAGEWADGERVAVGPFAREL